MALTTSLAALASLIESGAADAQLVAQIASIAFIAEAGAATVTYIDSDGNSTPEGSLLIIKAGSRFIQVRVESRRAPAKAASRRVVARTIH
jgi:hypothetical protein